MEGYDHRKYRGDLSQDIRSIKKHDPEAAREILASEKKSKRYQIAEEAKIDGRNTTTENTAPSEENTEATKEKKEISAAEKAFEIIKTSSDLEFSVLGIGNVLNQPRGDTNGAENYTYDHKDKKNGL